MEIVANMGERTLRRKKKIVKAVSHDVVGYACFILGTLCLQIRNAPEEGRSLMSPILNALSNRNESS